MSLFMKFLETRNSDFVSHFTSESAIGLYDTERSPRKNCVLISFDPPVGAPEIVFNWKASDVWYLKNPSLENETFDRIDKLVKDSANSQIVFLERESPEHLRKIQRFIRNYQKRVTRNQPVSSLPGFVLAEYRGPFARIKLKELREDQHGTLHA